MREKEYSADTTDLMTRDLDGYAVRARELLPAPVELRTINNSADEIGSFQYTWRNFIDRINPTAIFLAVLISALLDCSFRWSRSSCIAPIIGTDMAHEAHREEPSDVARANVTPLVGTINEPAANRIDMNEFDNVVDGSGIEGRTGNFLFTVGSVASGKSTLQNFSFIGCTSTKTFISTGRAVTETLQVKPT